MNLRVKLIWLHKSSICEKVLMYIQFPNRHLWAVESKCEYYFMNSMMGTNISLLQATVRNTELLLIPQRIEKYTLDALMYKRKMYCNNHGCLPLRYISGT